MGAAARRRAHRGRARGVRRGSRGHRRPGAAGPWSARPVRHLRSTQPWLRPRPGTPTLAHAGFRGRAGVPGGRGATGHLPPPRRGRGGRALARHGAGFTGAFEDTAAWLAVHTSRVAVAELLRVAWRTAGRMLTRVAEEAGANVDRLEGLRRIGIDEVSHRKGHRYLTVVVDHDTGRLVWAAPGHDEATLHRFFDALGPHRSGQLSLVSADAADWIAGAVAARCPRQCCAWTPSTSSAGPPTRWTRSAARPGTPHGAAGSRRWPASSRVPGSPCGRTRST